jgi:hypothetical protein
MMFVGAMEVQQYKTTGCAEGLAAPLRLPAWLQVDGTRGD